MILRNFHEHHTLLKIEPPLDSSWIYPPHLLNLSGGYILIDFPTKFLLISFSLTNLHMQPIEISQISVFQQN
jgi:hypothetical protein